MKVARNVLINMLYSRLVHLCDDDLGTLDPAEGSLAEAVFLTQALQKLKSSTKLRAETHLVIEIDQSNDGYGGQ